MCLGIPAQIVELAEDGAQTAKVNVSGVYREVNIACVNTAEQPSKIGDWVLVHVGFAMSRIDEEEANKTLALLEELGEIEEELELINASNQS